jgi:hypothetical protein
VHTTEPVPTLYVPVTHELHPHCCGVLETFISWIDIAREAPVAGNTSVLCDLLPFKSFHGPGY